MNFRNWSDVGNFQESGNSPVVMHLLKSLDNHSDIMQLAIFKNTTRHTTRVHHATPRSKYS